MDITSTESENYKQEGNESCFDDSRNSTESGGLDEEKEKINDIMPDECPGDKDTPLPSTEELPEEKSGNNDDAAATEQRQDYDAIESLIQRKFEDLELRLQEMASERQALVEKLASSDERFYQLTQTVQEDRYRKDKTRLLKACIDEANLIRSSLNDFRKRRDNGELEKSAEEELEEMLVKIVNHFYQRILRTEHVEVLPEAVPGSDFQEDTQEIVDSVQTDDPQMAGKVACSESPAYVWTLPYILKARVDGDGNEINSYRFLLEREKVIIYKNQN